MQIECKTGSDSWTVKTQPADLRYESACRPLLSTVTIAIFIIVLLNWYQNEVGGETWGVDSRDRVKHNERSDR